MILSLTAYIPIPILSGQVVSVNLRNRLKHCFFFQLAYSAHPQGCILITDGAFGSCSTFIPHDIALFHSDSDEDPRS